MQTPLQPDPLASRRAFRRAARGPLDFELPRESARRLMSRLGFMNIDPARILDIGCGHGDDLAALRDRYERAEIIGVDFALEALWSARRRRPLSERARSWFGRAGTSQLCAEMLSLPIADAAIGLVWSNLSASWAPDVLGAFREWHRVLEPGGLVIFSAYGPDTLRELRQAFARVSDAAHVHEFIDMHDLGDMLVAAGFASPVMDVDRITLTYAGVDGLMRDLKGTGQVNTAHGRSRGLLGRRSWAAMVEAYEVARRDGRIPASIELVFGHAWKAQARRARAEPEKQWAPIRLARKGDVIKRERDT